MEIRVEAHGPHVAVVTIDNQPRRNAMTRQMMAELAAQWDALQRARYRCIVLTGAGDRAFSSGADLAGDLSADPALAAVVNHALLKHHPYTKPIVAALNAQITQEIYALRTKAGLTQKQLAELVKTTDSVISRLEDADYAGHSLKMLQRISAALNRRLEIHFVPLRGRRRTA